VPTSSAVPTITDATTPGSFEAGDALTASAGAWSGVPTPTYAYQWELCDAAGSSCADIAGASSSSVASDRGEQGQALRVVVTATNSAGSASATSTATPAIQAPPEPASGGAPTIADTTTGAYAVGDVLSGTDGSFTGYPAPASSLQWLLCPQDSLTGCVPIAGATSASYTVSIAEVGSYLALQATATNASGQSTATSAPVGPVPAPAPVTQGPTTSTVEAVAPANTSAPSISIPSALEAGAEAGTALPGESLTARTGAWAGTAPIAYSYQWRACTASAPTCPDIPGATGQGYVPAASYQGARLLVQVTASNGAGSATATSIETAPLGAPLVAPVITKAHLSHRCEAPFSLTGTTLTDPHGLTLTLDLNTSARLSYSLSRRVGSPAWTRCPAAEGDEPGRYVPVWSGGAPAPGV
jgi:hypothetical protein